MAIYRLFWDSYCSWYLEIVKPAWGGSIDRITYDATVTFFDKLLRLIHPVMPFITEELWQSMAERKEGETIMFQPTPKAGDIDHDFLAGFEIAQGAVNGVRAIRAQKQISPKQKLGLRLEGKTLPEMDSVLGKLANVELLDKAPEGPASTFIVGTVQCSVPLSGLVDSSEEKDRLENGIDVDVKTLEEMKDCADYVGVDYFKYFEDLGVHLHFNPKEHTQY